MGINLRNFKIRKLNILKKPKNTLNIKTYMNLKKKLFNVQKCPICSKKKFINHGLLNGIHPDLFKLCNLFECKNCNHWFLSKMPKKDFIEELYKKNSQYVFHNEYVKNVKKKSFIKKQLMIQNLNTNHWIFKFMKNHKRGNYLEIGPGDCNLLKTFRKFGWTCEGLELQKIYKVKGVHTDIKKISTKNKNVLVFHDVLEHVVDPVSILRKFSKQQKSGDKLFLAYPNSSSFKAMILKDKWNMVAPLAHLNFFSVESTKILLKRCGYYPYSIKQTSFVVLKKILRNIIRLPITFLLDILNFRISSAFKRIPEIILNLLDLIKGDQMNVIAIKK
jgi:hypothetical protein